jgi:hypothetical protein
MIKIWGWIKTYQIAYFRDKHQNIYLAFQFFATATERYLLVNRPMAKYHIGAYIVSYCINVHISHFG